VSPMYTVRAFRAARADVPRPEVFFMSGWGEWETLYFYVIVIQSEGINALINTGPPRDLEILNIHWRAFAGERCHLIRESRETPEEILKSAGLTPADITHVLLTPLQLYATANLMLFRNAQICMMRRGWIEDLMARPLWLHVPRELCISDETLNDLIFSSRDRVRLLDDEEDVCPGIHASWVGTHHRSSTLYSIRTAKGLVGVSDCAFKYGNLDGRPLGIGESLEEGYNAYKRIRKEIQHFLPLYDPEVLERYPGGVVA
jgi:glyoxylase-like metal-dependent hydrolase (beta-lactamase superfamily II)